MRQDHPQVVSGAAQQCVQRITLGTLEPVARQQPVALHVADHRLDHLAPLEQLLQRRWQAPCVVDQQSAAGRWCDTPVAAVGQDDLRCLPRQDADLLELAVHGVSVIRIAWHRAHATTSPSLAVTATETLTPNS